MKIYVDNQNKIQKVLQMENQLFFAHFLEMRNQ